MGVNKTKIEVDIFVKDKCTPRIDPFRKKHTPDAFPRGYIDTIKHTNILANAHSPPRASTFSSRNEITRGMVVEGSVLRSISNTSFKDAP